ncbi:unnamed protein product, partial [Callosobruchus maculatus]
QVLTLCVLVGIVQARPQLRNTLQRLAGAIPSILRYDFDNNGFGGFSYTVDTSDGFHEFAEGELKNPGTDNEAQVIQGRYSYVGDDGQTYEVEYRADENGFMAAGDHIPKGAAGTVPKGQLGIPSAAAASLAGGGLG